MSLFKIFTKVPNRPETLALVTKCGNYLKNDNNWITKYIDSNGNIPTGETYLFTKRQALKIMETFKREEEERDVREKREIYLQTE